MGRGGGREGESLGGEGDFVANYDLSPLSPPGSVQPAVPIN